MDHAITVDNLVKRYGAVQAVNGLGFQVERCTTCGLLRGNGVAEPA